MSEVLNGCYDAELDDVTVIDCRYPYEFEGGHIQVASIIFEFKGLPMIFNLQFIESFELWTLHEEALSIFLSSGQVSNRCFINKQYRFYYSYS